MLICSLLFMKNTVNRLRRESSDLYIYKDKDKVRVKSKLIKVLIAQMKENLSRNKKNRED